MSSKSPSPRVVRFMEKHRDEAALETPRWPLRRLLVVLVGMPVLVVGAFYVYLIYAMSTCGCTPLPTFPASPADGVVVGVDSAGLGDVRSFNLRLANGGIVSLQLGTLENATEFSPSHLAEHLATSSPVRAYFRISADGYRAVVYRLEDAPPPT